jgi:hypothetical protein
MLQQATSDGGRCHAGRGGASNPSLPSNAVFLCAFRVLSIAWVPDQHMTAFDPLLPVATARFAAD